MKPILEFFYRAYAEVSANAEYCFEMDMVDHIDPIEKQSPGRFFIEYVYVVLNAGMKEQIAKKIFDKWTSNISDFSVIRHAGKRKAIENVFWQYEIHFRKLQAIKTQTEQIDYLETLPWIGPITKYHLARNIGIDTVKPDRHLTRLAEQFGYSSPLEMCKVIQDETKLKLGTIDVILWRYCNLTGGKLAAAR